jgi:hypothetical protein
MVVRRAARCCCAVTAGVGLAVGSARTACLGGGRRGVVAEPSRRAAVRTGRGGATAIRAGSAPAACRLLGASSLAAAGPGFGDVGPRFVDAVRRFAASTSITAAASIAALGGDVLPYRRRILSSIPQAPFGCAGPTAIETACGAEACNEGAKGAGARCHGARGQTRTGPSIQLSSLPPKCRESSGPRYGPLAADTVGVGAALTTGGLPRDR